jgi:hypothetical protein
MRTYLNDGKKKSRAKIYLTPGRCDIFFNRFYLLFVCLLFSRQYLPFNCIWYSNVIFFTWLCNRKSDFSQRRNPLNYKIYSFYRHQYGRFSECRDTADYVENPVI